MTDDQILAFSAAAFELLIITLDCLTEHYQATTGVRRVALIAIRLLNVLRWLKPPLRDAKKVDRASKVIGSLVKPVDIFLPSRPDPGLADVADD